MSTEISNLLEKAILELKILETQQKNLEDKISGQNAVIEYIKNKLAEEEQNSSIPNTLEAIEQYFIVHNFIQAKAINIIKWLRSQKINHPNKHWEKSVYKYLANNPQKFEKVAKKWRLLSNL